jgi:hypothetical protein
VQFLTGDEGELNPLFEELRYRKKSSDSRLNGFSITYGRHDTGGANTGVTEKIDQRTTPDCDCPAPASRDHDSDYCQPSATDYRSDLCQPPLGEIEADRRSEHLVYLPSKEASHQKV